ncbi:MAG: DNA primase [Flavobacteriaceae bacterium TMED200]|nr:DNA primase [Flavobacteriaceae bacterium]OUW66649.1 MAG: DNA primase [Flavobacteriaceae bacterium TMED200]
MISKTTINNIFEAARVEEVISDFISLKKAGSSFKGLSPFSQEKTPSFMVSPAKQIWKDFSSGKGGNVVAFLMEHEGFSYPEALKYLGKKYNIEIKEFSNTPEEQIKFDLRESIYIALSFSCEYYMENLNSTDKGKSIGMSYLNTRGFSMESIKKFGLGISFNEKKSFTNHALKKGYEISILEKSGLTIKEGKEGFDRFKNRIMFPIKSISGRVLGYGARIMSSSSKIAKYINSPESEVYQKSKVLYGLFESKSNIIKEDNCLLVEGYTDVIQLHQKGIKNVVSSSGTALSSDQIMLVKRLTENITVIFDRDQAGINAALRGIDLILEHGMNVRICKLDEGQDPDSLARKHSLDYINDFINQNSLDFINFKASLLATEYENEPTKKAEVINNIVKSISLVKDIIKRELYVQTCSKIMNISEDSIFGTLSRIKNSKENRFLNKPSQSFNIIKNKSSKEGLVDELYELEKKIITILILYGQKTETFNESILIFSEEDDEIIEKNKYVNSKVYEKIFLDLQQDEIEFANKEFRDLFNILMTEYQIKGYVSIEKIVPGLSSKLSEIVSSIVLQEEKHFLHKWDKKSIYVKLPSENVSVMVTETILSLRKLLVSKKIESLQENIKSKNNKNVLEDVMGYYQLRRIVSSKLNRVL